eukprot:4099921-Pyramimonas_sp.AAC.1
MGICETHLLPDKQKKVTVDLDRDGWKTAATAARPSGLSGAGCCGGRPRLVMCEWQRSSEAETIPSAGSWRPPATRRRAT